MLQVFDVDILLAIWASFYMLNNQFTKFFAIVALDETISSENKVDGYFIRDILEYFGIWFFWKGL